MLYDETTNAFMLIFGALVDDVIKNLDAIVVCTYSHEIGSRELNTDCHLRSLLKFPQRDLDQHVVVKHYLL